MGFRMHYLWNENQQNLLATFMSENLYQFLSNYIDLQTIKGQNINNSTSYS